MRNEESERGGNRDADKDRNRTRGRKCVYNITFINYGMRDGNRKGHKDKEEDTAKGCSS